MTTDQPTLPTSAQVVALIETACAADIGAAAHLMDDRQPAPPLWPPEDTFVSRAVATRRDEFARGRACARNALGQLGVPAGPILASSSRAPIWPAGVTGSITHCAGLVAAGVAHTGAIDAMGLDAEPFAALEADLVARVASPREREALAGGPWDASRSARLVFSAKETVHKCIEPLTGEMLDFLDVELTVDTAGAAFAVAPISEAARSVEPLARLRGRYLATDDFVITAAVVVAAP